VGTAWRDYMQDPDEASFGQTRHPVTWWLLGILVGLWFVYAGSLSWGGPSSGLFVFFHEHLSLHPDDVLWRGHVWQPLTAVFLHSPVGVGHVLMNVLGIIMFGRYVERILGSRGLLTLFLRAGLVCTISILPLWLLLGEGQRWTAHGASGSVYGIAAFLALRHPHLPIYFILIRMPLWVFVGVLMVGIEVVNLVVLANPAASTVGHLAGAAYGYVHHRWLASDVRGPGLLARWRARWRAGQERRGAVRTADEKARVEGLLDKISRDGIGSLTGAEKDFLQRASKRYPHA
jgi:membrane associated rhomboid family serine protease